VGQLRWRGFAASGALPELPYPCTESLDAGPDGRELAYGDPGGIPPPVASFPQPGGKSGQVAHTPWQDNVRVGRQAGQEVTGSIFDHDIMYAPGSIAHQPGKQALQEVKPCELCQPGRDRVRSANESLVLFLC